MRVAFTGHRQLPCTEDSEKAMKLQFLIVREICERIANHADTFLCGGARGADIICGEMVLDIRQSRPDIKAICKLEDGQGKVRL